MNAVIITGMICLTIIFVSAMIFLPNTPNDENKKDK